MSDLRIKIILFDINNLKDDFLNLSYITEEDKINALKYKNLLDQKQHIVSSYLKRKYVKDYYLDEFKKPKSNNLFFNISHSKNLVGIALGNVDLGLDIEFKDKDRKEELINYVCNQDELNKIKEESDFYKIWTSKESLLKCVGTGLVNDIKNITSLPLNGLKKYNDSYFYSHYIDYFDYSISVTLTQNKDFDIDLIIEEANYERIISTI